MKVLIETLNNRKGYKFFENRKEMDAYLGRHCGNIASYEILQEDDTASTNDFSQYAERRIGRPAMPECKA